MNPVSPLGNSGLVVCNSLLSQASFAENLQYHRKHDEIAEQRNIPSAFQGTQDSKNHR